MLHKQAAPSFSGRSVLAPALPTWRHGCGSRQPHRPRPVTTAAGNGSGGLFGGFFGGGNSDKQRQQQTQQKQRPEQQPPQPSSSSASAPQFPPYTVVQKGPVYTLRFYNVYTAVTTQYSRREEGYLALGRYMDGANAEGVKFAYSQPMIMRYEPDGGPKVMQMYVGSRRDGTPAAAAPPPAPTDAGVVLEAAGGELVAVLQFDGFITPATAEAARLRLVKALQADGLALAEPEARGLFRAAQYGAVYTLEQRLNELMLRVAV